MERWESVGRVNEAWVILALLAAGCGQNHLLGVQEYSNLNGPEALQGSGCVQTEEGNGMGAGTAPAPVADDADAQPQVSFEYKGTGDAVHFIVRDDGGATLAERNYDVDFLDADKHDEVIVEVGSLRLRFEHWGEASCGNGAPTKDTPSSTGN
jgi:hypothetical protein